ncbi:MAG: sulfur carrier protein ThiS [Leptospiraceae bacterium]|nr:sulfur carrier protein ThiS [Leptospiraceae bacterium]
MIVNGKTISLNSLSKNSIPGLLEFLNLSPTTIAIEKNGEILEKDSWEKEEIKDSDSIEIIKFVGGG